MKYTESLPAGMHVVSNREYTCTQLHRSTLSGAMSVVKSLVVWYHVNTPLSGMVVVTLTQFLPVAPYLSFPSSTSLSVLSSLFIMPLCYYLLCLVNMYNCFYLHISNSILQTSVSIVDGTRIFAVRHAASGMT